MRKVIASVLLAVALSGCAATTALKAVTSLAGGDTPDLTAQVGQENTKQGLGVTSKVETSTSTTVRDVSGGSTVTQKTTKKAQQVETGPVTATNMTVTTSDNKSLLWAFAIGMSAVLGLVFWFVPTPKQLLASKENADA
jgi:hypothetical protein